MHMAAPMKSEKASGRGVVETPSIKVPPLFRSSKGIPTSAPRANGRITPLSEIVRARRPSFRMRRGSSSRPTRNIKKTRPRSASWRSGTSGGKSCVGSPGEMRPRRVGPKNMPATISPITPGCPIFRASVPNRRAAAIITARSNNKKSSISAPCFMMGLVQSTGVFDA